jgi:hypothetical protein
MTPGIRITAAVVALAFIVIAPADPDAAPRFSEWSAPVNLGGTVNSGFIDAGAAISKDGLSLYFHSDRPGGFGSNDIWMSRRAALDTPWGPPLNLGAVINTSALDNAPVLSRDEHWLFFNSTRTGGYGGFDLWASYRAHTHDDFAWQPPINLGTGVNSMSLEAAASFFENDDDGLPLLFFTRLPGALGNADTYVSAATADGSFGPATLVPELSSAANDQRPSVRFDGLEVFLQSDRVGSFGGFDLWVSTRETLSQAWSIPINLGSTVNSTSSVQQPHIAADRETLFFASNRPGGFGGQDLYVTTRARTNAR